MVGYMYGLWKIGISTNGGKIKNLHQPETQKLFFFHKQTPFQNIKAHFAYLIVMICTRVRVRGERVRASGAAWPLQRCRVEQRTRDHRHRTLHCAGTAAWVRGWIVTTASPSLQRATWQHPAPSSRHSADLGRLWQGSPTPPRHLPRLSAQRGDIGPRILSGFIRASFYRTIIFILLLNMNSATLQHTHWHTVKLFRLDRIEKTHAQCILMYVM